MSQHRFIALQPGSKSETLSQNQKKKKKEEEEEEEEEEKREKEKKQQQQQSLLLISVNPSCIATKEFLRLGDL